MIYQKGSDVTLLALDGEEEFEVDPELEAVLLESIAQGQRGETISAEEPPARNAQPRMSAELFVEVTDLRRGRSSRSRTMVAREPYGCSERREDSNWIAPSR